MFIDFIEVVMPKASHVYGFFIRAIQTNIHF